MGVKMFDYDRYYFNDIYDDELIRDKFHDWQNRVYDDILRGKGWYQNNRIINGDIFDLSIDDNLNLMHGFNPGTYSLQLTVNIIPFYSELEFFTKYGYGKTISAMDIMKDNKIFSKNVFFYVNGHLIHDVKFKIWRDHSLIFIEPSNSDISKDDMDGIIFDNNGDDTWTLYFTTKSDYYLTTKSRSVLFDGNKVYLSNFTESRKYNKPSKYNSWNFYISTGTSYNVMSATSATLESDENGEYFLISNAFKQLIKEQAATLRCLVVNEPECTGRGEYINTEDTQAIFQIPFKKNPIPLRNLVIWEYDHETGRKMHPLVPVVKMYYPNIYDFEAMMNQSYLIYLYTNSHQLVRDKKGLPIVLGSTKLSPPIYDLYVEWIEPMSDASEYDSYIQDYIDCYKDEYTDMRVSGNLPEKIKNFTTVVDLKAGATDYIDSPYRGDYRAWRLSKLLLLLEDNPKRYDELYEKLFYNAKKYLCKSYTYEETPEIYNRSVDSTREFCHEDQDVLVNFTSPQAYIQVYDYQDEKKPVFLWFNGVFQLPTNVLKYGSTLYVFFPVSSIEGYPMIEMEVSLIDSDILKKVFGFSRLSSSFDLEKCGFHRNIAMDNLLFYQATDGLYVDKGKFDYQLQISRSQIEYVGTGKVDWVDTRYQTEALYEVENELVIPTDFDFIWLESKNIPIDMGVDSASSQKLIDPRNIIISPAEKTQPITDVINKRFFVASTDFYDQRIFTVSDPYLRYYLYNNFKGTPSKEYFMVFANGLLVNPRDYFIIFNGYDKTARFEFLHEKYPKDTSIHIQYLGYANKIVYNDTISSLQEYDRDGDNLLYFEKTLSKLPFNKRTHRIYIEGARIPSDRIKTAGQGNLLIINDTTVNDFRNIIILEQRHDDDSFDYIGRQFLDDIATDDETFFNYLIDQYK